MSTPASRTIPPAGVEPDDRLDERSLTRAGHPVHGDDLSTGHRQVDMVEAERSAFVDHGQSRRLEDHVPGRGGFVDRQCLDRGPDHRPGERGGAGVRRRTGPHHLAALEDGDIVGDAHHLAQLVGDEHDRPAGRAQLGHRRQQLIDVGRPEDRRRLVEDQQIRAPMELAEQLEAAEIGDADIAGRPVPRQLPAGPGLETGRRRLDRGEVERASPNRLDAEDEVLGQREIVDDRELLVDHADAERPGGLDRAHPLGLAVEPDAAGVGLRQAGDAPHQGRLAGSVLADDGVDRAGLDRHRDRVAGSHRPERLGQPDHLHARRSGWMIGICQPSSQSG